MNINNYSYNHNYNYNLHYRPTFTSNARKYTKDGKDIGTMTFLFRDDLKWSKFADELVDNFRNKDKVNVVQFASSDGAEAYSLIITLMEKYPELADKFTPIEAYDWDPVIVDAAKSGLLNIAGEDLRDIDYHVKNKNDYFKHTNRKLLIDNDAMQMQTGNYISDYSYTTYEVDKKLTDRVNFHQADMYDILETLEDNSNTVLMCRNILGYFAPKQITNFVDKVAQKLKPGSLFVIGEFDWENYGNLREYIQQAGFTEVMPCVYRKNP